MKTRRIHQPDIVISRLKRPYRWRVQWFNPNQKRYERTFELMEDVSRFVEGELLTMNDECKFEFDGEEDGLEWYLCTTHGQLTIGDTFPCNGYGEVQ